MTNIQREKQYQFVKLCIALTKQGFQFTKGENYTLIFPLSYKEARKIRLVEKLPFVDSWSVVICNKHSSILKPNQWSDRIK